MRDKKVDPDTFVRPAGVDPAATLTVVRVPAEWARWRVDRVVVATFTRMSRTRAQKVVRAGAFAEHGKPLRPNDRVGAGDVILLYRPPFEEPDLPTDLPILYEDDALLAVDKPSGLPVHPTARYHHRTVTAVLAARRPTERLGLCHRIDRETSGVLLLAKDLPAERFVKRALEERGVVTKTYLCITWGVIEPSCGRIEHALKLDEQGRLRVKMRVGDGEADALSAATRYEVLEARTSRVTGQAYALVRCDLETGRQHQIRAHLSARGTPIVGDKLYAGARGLDEEVFMRASDGLLTDEDRERLELPRHALHAHRLALPNPRRPDEIIGITSELPEDLVEFWEALKT